MHALIYADFIWNSKLAQVCSLGDSVTLYNLYVRFQPIIFVKMLLKYPYTVRMLVQFGPLRK
jgi:hypothetical protein